MATPAEIFNDMVQKAQAEASAQAAQASQAGAQKAEASLTDLTNSIKQQTEANAKINERLDAITQVLGRTANPSAQGADPMKAFEETTGIPAASFAPVASAYARTEAERVFDEKLGPLVRQAEAVQNYQSKNKTFDLVKMQAYVAENPDVAAVVDQAAKRGDYETGIAYAETRRLLDEKISAEAKGQVRKDKRKDFINTTRPDAQVVGASGAGNPAGLNVNPAPMTADQIQNVFANLNAGNSQPFIDAFHKPNLPSEEEFQRLAFGSFA